MMNTTWIDAGTGVACRPAVAGDGRGPDAAQPRRRQPVPLQPQIRPPRQLGDRAGQSGEIISRCTTRRLWPSPSDYPPVYVPPPPGFVPPGPPGPGIGFSVGFGVVAPLYGWGHPTGSAHGRDDRTAIRDHQRAPRDRQPHHDPEQRLAPHRAGRGRADRLVASRLSTPRTRRAPPSRPPSTRRAGAPGALNEEHRATPAQSSRPQRGASWPRRATASGRTAAPDARGSAPGTDTGGLPHPGEAHLTLEVAHPGPTPNPAASRRSAT